MDWFLTLKNQPNCPDIDRDFRIWIARSKHHERAWRHAVKTWTLIGEVPQAHAHLRPAAPPPAALLQPRGRWKRRAATGLGVALAACLLLVVASPFFTIWFEADYRTQVAERRTVRLADGTVIEMGAGSAISADLSATARRVTLLSGEAFFDVAHDAGRPFTVDAGGVDVVVLGTAFDVQLAGGATTVELARGTVAVSHAAAAQPDPFELSPGEMAVVDHESGAVTRSAIAQEDIAAWRTGRMFVNDVTVAAVVERLQRYHPAWIAVPDRSLASRRVTGLYDLKDPDRALQALVQPFGGKVRSVTAYGRLLARF